MPTPKKIAQKSTKEIIEHRIKNLENGMGKTYASKDPFFSVVQREDNKDFIEFQLLILEDVFQKIVPYIKNIRRRIEKVVEQTDLASVYLLLWKAMRRWEVIFLLAREGRNQEVLELLRSLHENLDLVIFFLEEKNQSELKKWFEGEIIEAGKTREQFDELLQKHSIADYEVPALKMKSFIYQIFSKYPHNSYVALLDFVNAYTEELDENRSADYHWVRHNFSHIFSAMATTVIVMKGLYLKLGEMKDYKDLDDILKTIHVPSSDEELRESIKKFNESES